MVKQIYRVNKTVHVLLLIKHTKQVETGPFEYTPYLCISIEYSYKAFMREPLQGPRTASVGLEYCLLVLRMSQYGINNIIPNIFYRILHYTDLLEVQIPPSILTSILLIFNYVWIDMDTSVTSHLLSRCINNVFIPMHIKEFTEDWLFSQPNHLTLILSVAI